MSEKVEVDKEILMNVHNAISQMHPTGDDIIVAAAVMMDLRKLINEEQESE